MAGYAEHQPLVPLKEAEKRRRLWVSPGVSDLLTGAMNPGAMFPCGAADAIISKFCKGWLVSATRREKGKAEFKWFRDLDEVWTLSFPKPAPGWRVLGRFARKNEFVALHWYDRHDLADKITYTAKAMEMIAEWELRFPGIEPYRGKAFADYLGDMHRDTDDQQG